MDDIDDDDNVVVPKKAYTKKQLERMTLPQLKKLLPNPKGGLCNGPGSAYMTDGQICVMEAVAWVTGEEECTDTPSCADECLTGMMIDLNDSDITHDERQQLIGMIPHLVGTRTKSKKVLQRRFLHAQTIGIRYILRQQESVDALDLKMIRKMVTGRTLTAKQLKAIGMMVQHARAVLDADDDCWGLIDAWDDIDFNLDTRVKDSHYAMSEIDAVGDLTLKQRLDAIKEICAIVPPKRKKAPKASAKAKAEMTSTDVQEKVTSKSWAAVDDDDTTKRFQMIELN